VFRVYDNRLACSTRKPDVYLLMGEAHEVCALDDPSDDGPIVPLGDCREEGCDRREWLWTFRGRCAVYVTKFHEGRHVARSALEFVPLVDHLLSLHRMGLVHGDIRCSNIVFGPDAGGGPPNCRLIDFDFGGKIDITNGTPTYPPGYCSYLEDGRRRGEGGKIITLRDDWFALGGVIFRFHDFRRRPPAGAAHAAAAAAAAATATAAAAAAAAPPFPPSIGPSSSELLAYRDDYELEVEARRLKDFGVWDAPDDLSEIEQHAMALKTYLRTVAAAGWQVSPAWTLARRFESSSS
jgi:serine/threonine protein kinase